MISTPQGLRVVGSLSFFKKGTWGPFLESPGNFLGPELYFKIKIYRTLA